MQGSNLENITPNLSNTNSSSDEPTIVQTDVGAKDGQNKCPKCGATDISLNVNTGKLRCNFCRHEFEPIKVEGLQTDISKLEGQIIGSGAQDIVADTNDVVTFKCSSCGAEVVIDTASSTQARCHWCRNTLSINQQIPNGSVPDVVLPFQMKKDVAKKQIENFVGKRKFFAHPKFRQEFTTQNIMGVYFPYMVVDVNSHLYNVSREFDLTINGLTIESNLDRLDTASSNKTNNVINSIMPFDIENCVRYDSNYLKGYTSERRDTNIEQLKNLVETQSKDVARFAANETLKQYDRGVAWSSEQFDVKGQQWKATYLPVWLYSYQQVKGDKKLLHYVAVNARTGETMGSVPIHMPKLFLISAFVEILGILAMVFIDFDYNWIFLTLGIIYFLVMYARYRNSGARHNHETETKSNMSNLIKSDVYVTKRKDLKNSRMDGANNTVVNGQNAKKGFLDSITENNSIVNTINKTINKK